MQLWLKGLLLSVLAFGASWFSAIWYWRSTNRMPATSELATALVVLPLALLLGCWAAAKGAALWKARSEADPAAPAQDAAAPADAAPAAAVAPPVLTIAAAALRAPHGESAAELAEAMASHRARPGLDASLLDDDGFPVMCARAAYADETAIEQEIGQWRRDGGLAPLAAQPEFWRALALATPVARELAVTVASHEALTATPAQHAIPMLQLALLAPSGWNVAWRDAAGQWLLQQVANAGWPRQRMAVTAYPDGSPGALLAALHGGGHPCLALVLACASHVGGETVQRWAERNTLFTARQPQGWMPGEAAAGLLLASGDHAALLSALPAQAPQLAAIHTGINSDNSGKNGNHADDSNGGTGGTRGNDGNGVNGVNGVNGGNSGNSGNSGNVGVGGNAGEAGGAASAGTGLGAAATLAQLAQAACHTPSQPQPPQDAVPALIVADTGHRSAQVMELMAAAHALLPQLDPTSDIATLGNATGHAGGAGALAALAMAAHEAQHRNAPVLCLTNEDPQQRCAVLIRPAASVTPGT